MDRVTQKFDEITPTDVIGLADEVRQTVSREFLFAFRRTVRVNVYTKQLNAELRRRGLPKLSAVEIETFNNVAETSYLAGVWNLPVDLGAAAAVTDAGGIVVSREEAGDLRPPPGILSPKALGRPEHARRFDGATHLRMNHPENPNVDADDVGQTPRRHQDRFDVVPPLPADIEPSEFDDPAGIENMQVGAVGAEGDVTGLVGSEKAAEGGFKGFLGRLFGDHDEGKNDGASEGAPVFDEEGQMVALATEFDGGETVPIAMPPEMADVPDIALATELASNGAIPALHSRRMPPEIAAARQRVLASHPGAAAIMADLDNHRAGRVPAAPEAPG